MSKAEIAVVEPRSLAKGLMAGLVAGLVGTVAMALAERLLPGNAKAKAKPDAKAADGIRWGFGAAVGAAYGAVAEFYPAATAKEGVTFGMTLGALNEEGVLPALGLLTKPGARDSIGEVTSHVVFGVTTEVVRGLVRKHL
jgi:putative membrane protein